MNIQKSSSITPNSPKTSPFLDCTLVNLFKQIDAKESGSMDQQELESHMLLENTVIDSQ